MGKDWARIRYQAGEIVGKCEYVEDRPTWKKQIMGIFKCLQSDCGKEFISPTRMVRDGKTVSCGCLRHKTIKTAMAVRRTHGMSNHPMYNRWYQIKGRCFKESNYQYKDYGGRGITLYEPWIKDFKAFYNYTTTLPGYNEDMIKGHGITMDRIDNDGNYEPGNLRWTDGHTQATNQRKRSTNTSGYVGVHLTGSKWQSSIRVNDKSEYIGRFASREEAALARDYYIIDNGLWEYDLQFITHYNLTT